jgi:hypothetical protein
VRGFLQRRFLVRLVAALVALAVAAFTFAWFFALPLEARYFGRKMPVLKKTPVPLRDTVATDSPGKKMTFCGTEFELPWADLDDGKTKSGVNLTTLFFDSGLVTMVKCEPPREFVDGVLDSIHLKREIFRRVFGDRAVESDYALTRLMLETTPDSVRFFGGSRTQGPMLSMLVLKAMGTPPADTGIFSIHTPEFDGFQYQNPAAGSGMITMNLFSEDRGLWFQFYLKYKGASARISQGDINRITQTLYKVGPYPPRRQPSPSGARLPR